MTKYEALKSEIEANPANARAIQEKFIMSTISQHIDGLAWDDTRRTEPAGVNRIKSRLMAALKADYGDILDVAMASSLAEREASMYY